MKKKILTPGWIKIGDQYIRFHAIESIDDTGHFIRTVGSRTYMVPRNQRAKVVRMLGIFEK